MGCGGGPLRLENTIENFEWIPQPNMPNVDAVFFLSDGIVYFYLGASKGASAPKARATASYQHVAHKHGAVLAAGRAVD